MMLTLWEMVGIAAALTLCVFMGVTMALVIFFAPPPRCFDDRPDDAPGDRKPAMPTPPPEKTCSMPIPMPTMHHVDLTA